MAINETKIKIMFQIYVIATTYTQHAHPSPELLFVYVCVHPSIDRVLIFGAVVHPEKRY